MQYVSAHPVGVQPLCHGSYATMALGGSEWRGDVSGGGSMRGGGIYRLPLATIIPSYFLMLLNFHHITNNSQTNTGIPRQRTPVTRRIRSPTSLLK